MWIVLLLPDMRSFTFVGLLTVVVKLLPSTLISVSVVLTEPVVCEAVLSAALPPPPPPQDIRAAETATTCNNFNIVFFPFMG